MAQLYHGRTARTIGFPCTAAEFGRFQNRWELEEELRSGALKPADCMIDSPELGLEARAALEKTFRQTGVHDFIGLSQWPADMCTRVEYRHSTLSRSSRAEASFPQYKYLSHANKLQWFNWAEAMDQQGVLMAPVGVSNPSQPGQESYAGAFFPTNPNLRPGLLHSVAHHYTGRLIYSIPPTTTTAILNQRIEVPAECMQMLVDLHAENPKEQRGLGQTIDRLIERANLEQARKTAAVARGVLVLAGDAAEESTPSISALDPQLPNETLMAYMDRSRSHMRMVFPREDLSSSQGFERWIGCFFDSHLPGVLKNHPADQVPGEQPAALQREGFTNDALGRATLLKLGQVQARARVNAFSETQELVISSKTNLRAAVDHLVVLATKESMPPQLQAHLMTLSIADLTELSQTGVTSIQAALARIGASGVRDNRQAARTNRHSRQPAPHPGRPPARTAGLAFEPLALELPHSRSPSHSLLDPACAAEGTFNQYMPVSTATASSPTFYSADLESLDRSQEVALAEADLEVITNEVGMCVLVCNAQGTYSSQRSILQTDCFRNIMGACTGLGQPCRVRGRTHSSKEVLKGTIVRALQDASDRPGTELAPEVQVGYFPAEVFDAIWEAPDSREKRSEYMRVLKEQRALVAARKQLPGVPAGTSSGGMRNFQHERAPAAPPTGTYWGEYPPYQGSPTPTPHPAPTFAPISATDSEPPRTLLSPIRPPSFFKSNYGSDFVGVVEEVPPVHSSHPEAQQSYEHTNGPLQQNDKFNFDCRSPSLTNGTPAPNPFPPSSCTQLMRTPSPAPVSPPAQLTAPVFSSDSDVFLGSEIVPGLHAASSFPLGAALETFPQLPPYQQSILLSRPNTSPQLTFDLFGTPDHNGPATTAIGDYGAPYLIVPAWMVQAEGPLHDAVCLIREYDADKGYMGNVPRIKGIGGGDHISALASAIICPWLRLKSEACPNGVMMRTCMVAELFDLPREVPALVGVRQLVAARISVDSESLDFTPSPTCSRGVVIPCQFSDQDLAEVTRVRGEAYADSCQNLPGQILLAAQEVAAVLVPPAQD